MMFFRLLSLAAIIGAGVEAIGEDYISEAPATVYEAEAMSPQNMDFDKDANMFIAHAGWYNNRLIHYYKFRMFTPSSYPDVITMTSTSADVPIQNIYFVTMDGTMDGVVGNPIIEFHTADGIQYSDFMEVVLVQAPDGYVADTYKSEGDILTEGAIPTGTGIILNIPVVPTGSTLQAPKDESVVSPQDTDSLIAPISSTTVWYKGVPVDTYVFEVTDKVAADYFASTREDPSDPRYAITVTQFAVGTFVNSIPIWHLNQYTHGVDDTNFGGPSDKGMRSIINLDRGDEGYSPLWQVFWMTELPINYSADDVSDNTGLSAANGFAQFTTPMFVNCPDIGAVGSENVDQSSSFETTLDSSQESNYVGGAHQMLIMKGGIPVDFIANDGSKVASTETNMMGAYEVEVKSEDIPEGTTEITVKATVDGEETEIRTITVTDGSMPGGSITPGDSTMSGSHHSKYYIVSAIVAVIMAVAIETN